MTLLGLWAHEEAAQVRRDMHAAAGLANLERGSSIQRGWKKESGGNLLGRAMTPLKFSL